MKKFLFLLLVLPSLFLTSCDKDKTADFEVVFQPQFDGQNLEFIKDYTFDGKAMSFQLFTLFLSDISLVKSDGSTVLLSEVDYFNFSQSDAADHSFTRLYEEVEKGDYTAIRFGVGVKESLNATTPADYSPAEPLGVSGAYWVDWGSYMFIRLAGTYDANGDGTKELPFIYHVGSDPTYREVTVEKPISVDENGKMTLVFDIQDWFMVDGQPFDVEGNPETPHGAGDIVLAQMLMGNIQAAFSVIQ